MQVDQRDHMLFIVIVKDKTHMPVSSHHLHAKTSLPSQPKKYGRVIITRTAGLDSRIISWDAGG